MRTSRAAGVAVVISAWVGPTAIAEADHFSATRSELLVERDHEIALTLHYGHAELVVQRTVWNGGDRHDQALFWIDVPEGAVAVGLRTLATLRGRPHWYDGELLEAELAAQRYTELTGIGGYYPKDPALLSWRSSQELALQVFPCPPQQGKSVEYTFVVPTSYEGGRHHLTLPQLGTATLPAEISVRGASNRDQIFIDGTPVGRGTMTTMTSEHAFSLGRSEAPALDGGLAVVPFADGRLLFHYDIAAATLSRVPAHADVVVLLDRSRSLDDEDRTAEVAMAHAYLGHFEDPELDARAAIVAFDRRPEDLLGGLVPVREAAALLENMTLQGRNGSHVDAALAHAETMLASASADRTRRIVLLTDRQMRSGLPMAKLEALAQRTGALVHVVDASAGDTAIDRLDGDPWSAVARTTGGVLWQASIDLETNDTSAIADTFEELARPVRIHGVSVAAPGLMAAHLRAPEVLDEGESASALLLMDRRVPHVILTGEQWAAPVRKVVLPTAAQGKLWSALVFGTELLESLTEPEMMTLAMHGRAVSPVTSYLAIEPGVRPSTEGLEHGEGSSSGGSGGIGSAGGGTGMGMISGVSVDLDALLRDHLEAAVDACGGEHEGASAALETTFSEIVEIGTVTIRGDAAIADCVREALWTVDLGAMFFEARSTWAVAL